MRFLLLFIMVAGFALPTVSSAAITRLTAQSSISAVTVYQDRALVTRTTTVKLKPGTQIIALEGLPVLLQDDSVRVEAKGTARAVITGIEVKRGFLARTADKRVKDIDEEITQIERKIGLLDSRKAGLLAQKKFIDSIKVAWGDRISHQLAAGKPTGTELNDAMLFVGNNTVKAEEQEREIEQEKRILKEQVDALKRKKQEIASSYRKENKNIEVLIETSKEGTMTLDISSVLDNATWEPSYDVRLSGDGKTAALSYRADVKQHTGEDWNKVNLTLSTARPSAGGAPPILHPWNISFYRPVPLAMPSVARRQESRMYKKSMKMEMDEALVNAEALPEMPAPVAFQTAEANLERTSVSFRIPGTVSIPSDNSRHSTMIATDTAPVTTEYMTVPKLSPVVYLSAELVNKASWPLLPGSIKIFSGDTFVGSSEMKQVASGEKFTLPFGSDEQITIKRDELKQHKEAGLFGKNRMAYNCKIEVNNLRKETQNITVKDQLPLAADNEIKVTLEETTLPPAEKKDDGTLIWKLKLAAGEKKTLSYSISVEYPKDKEIRGL